MRNFQNFLLISLLCFVPFVQAASLLNPLSEPGDSGFIKKRNFYLQNTSKEKRTVPLPHRSVNILIKESKRDSGELSRTTSADCLFDSLLKDSIRIRLFSEEKDIEYLNFFTNISTSYFEGNYDQAFKKVALKNIQYINMKTPFRHTMSRVGSVIMTLSIITIVSTPLTGLRLNSAERAAVRSQIFLTGLSGFVVAIPFFVIGRNKKYGISQEYETNSRNYWVLKEKFE